MADLIAERGIWVDPTIGEVELHREHEAAGRPELPEFDHWALPDVPSDLEPRLGFMRDMAERGVRFIGGMGMGMPIVTFNSVACSAQAYQRLLGFEPWRAIASITVDAAAALGLGETAGAIRPGLAADLVAVEGDPIDGPLGASTGPRCDPGRAVRRPGRPGACLRPGVSRLPERRDHGVGRRQVQVLRVEPEDALLGVVIGDHDDRVARGEPPDELDRGQLEGDRVDGHDRHRDRRPSACVGVVPNG